MVVSVVVVVGVVVVMLLCGSANECVRVYRSGLRVCGVVMKTPPHIHTHALMDDRVRCGEPCCNRYW